MKQSEFDEKAVAKTIRCGDWYREYVLNKFVFGCVDSSIKHIMSEYSGAKKEVTIYHLSCNATSLVRLQEKIF